MKKIAAYMLVVRCYLKSLIRGRADRVPNTPRRVCVVQRGKLGDMVCTTPLFSAIKRRYPAAEVWVVGDELNKHLLEGHPHVDGYIVWSGLSHMIREFCNMQFDFLCITGPNTEALAAGFLSSIPCIVTPIITGGWSPYESRSYKLLSHLVLTRTHQMGQYAPREYLRLLEPIDIETEDTTKILSYSPEAKDKAVTFMRSINPEARPVIGIAPGAGNKIKVWPAERFAAVADYAVSALNATVVIFGGPKDAEEVNHVLQAVKSRDYVHVAPALSLDELKAYIEQIDLFVSADTGPLYIAEAFSVATVDIVGPMDEREQPPQGSAHFVVVPPRERAELHIMNARVYDAAEAHRQVMVVTVPMVTAMIEKAISGILP